MTTCAMDAVLRRVRRAVHFPEAAALTDGQLLEAFIARKDEAAFEILVRRHGPMVFGVCRRLLGRVHDAEDAFQATFLVLARKAASVRPRQMVASWLHGVAQRTALKARALTARRQMRERQVTELPEPEAPQPTSQPDLLPLLDQELRHLPEMYRLPILLCDLEGKSIKQATQQLGWAQVTLAGRLARGRKMLAQRLARRGLTLSSGAVGMWLSQQAATAGVPASLVLLTVKAAGAMAACQPLAGTVSANVATLTEGVLKSMTLIKVKMATAVLLVLSLVGGTGVLALPELLAEKPDSKSTLVPPSSSAKKKEAVATPDGIGNPPQKNLNPQVQEAPTGNWMFGVGINSDAGLVGNVALNPKDKQPAPAKGDKENIQGVWWVVSIAENGKRVEVSKTAFLVDGNRACWQHREGDMQGGLYLDPSRQPKTYDFAMSSKTIEGIYELEGDTLRLCYDLGDEPKRPDKFASRPGSPHVLLTLKRQKGISIKDYRRPDGSKAFPNLIEPASKNWPPPVSPPAIKQVPPLASTPATSTLPPAKKSLPARVGQIFVTGNTRTPTSEILKHVPLFPGQILDYSSLKVAEKNLAALNLFVVDPQKGIRPTVTVIQSDGEFKDILIQVQQK